MAKKTQIDRAIESIESEIAVLQMAVQKLRQQQKTKAADRRPARAADPKTTTT